MHLRFLLFLAAASTLFSGCAQRVTTYPGPRRAASQVAHIPWHEAQREIRITAVDGRPVRTSHAHFELLPGWRTLEVVYTPRQTLHSYPVRVTFRADAGHQYALSAKTVVGRVESGAWAGKYRVAVYNLTVGREVGRSDRRPSDYWATYEAIGEVRRPAAGRDYDYR
jgi:hypothetical protein